MNAYIYIIYSAYVIMNQESLLVIVLLDESVPVYVYSTLCLHTHVFMYYMSVKLIHCSFSTIYTYRFCSPFQITIPGNDTTYWCHGFRLPETIRNEEKHMIRVCLP